MPCFVIARWHLQRPGILNLDQKLLTACSLFGISEFKDHLSHLIRMRLDELNGPMNLIYRITVGNE